MSDAEIEYQLDELRRQIAQLRVEVDKLTELVLRLSIKIRTEEA